MLQRKNRLREKKVFGTVFRFGKTVCDNNVCAKFYTTKTLQTQIGVIAGVKMFKQATKRNSAKRILRTAIKKYLPDIQKPVNIVLYFQKKPERLSLKKTSAAIENILKKARVLEKKTL
ncbi:MAG: ribonuclease P protein component [Candidatus Moranbacteria bacterium]|nr:ribonuclease P protein component [Candidatus Moranbacteria bacterium]